jgi:hypothetical protein
MITSTMDTCRGRVRRAAPGSRQGNAYVGLGPTTLSSGSTGEVKATPHVDFRPTRLVVMPSIATYFLLSSFTIGGKTQGVCSNPVSCEAFPPVPATMSPGDLTAWLKATMLSFDVCLAGEDIVLGVVNMMGSPAPFSAVLWGEAVWP